MTNWFSVDPRTHLAGKTAIVLGGSSGIGQAAANALAAAGANIVVSGVPAERCASAAEEIKAAGGTAVAVGCDATKQDEIDNVVNTAVKEFGGLDIVVSSCGYAPPGKMSLNSLAKIGRKCLTLTSMRTSFLLKQRLV